MSNISIMASGQGSNAKNIIEYFASYFLTTISIITLHIVFI
jgi:folate-dependent phosphoribosylglycinamide formyltransferase PurN